MFERLKHFTYRLRRDYFTRENSFLIIIFIFFALWAGSAIVAMSRNWEQQRNLEAKQAELAMLQSEVAMLDYEKQYYQTEEYQELAARHLQNKMLPGETMLRLPANSEEAKHKYDSEDATSVAALSNFEQWRKFLFP